MEYSAATAPFAFGKLIFTLPHLLVGIGAILAVVKGKAKPIVGVVGVGFTAIAVYLCLSDAIATVQCYHAAAKSEGTLVQGYVSNVEHLSRRGGTRSVRFMVGSARVSTLTSGVADDCGFIDSLGRSYQPKSGQSVEVLLLGDKPIKLKVSE
jgi:hypothetical protein